MAEKAKSRSKKQNVFQSFFRETTGELRKVSWPTWPEVRQLTGIVLMVSEAEDRTHHHHNHQHYAG